MVQWRSCVDVANFVLNCGVLMWLAGSTTGQLLGTRFLSSESGGGSSIMGAAIVCFLGLYCFGLCSFLNIVGLRVSVGAYC